MFCVKKNKGHNRWVTVYLAVVCSDVEDELGIVGHAGNVDRHQVLAHLQNQPFFGGFFKLSFADFVLMFIDQFVNI